jgi:hypothetical protein
MGFSKPARTEDGDRQYFQPRDHEETLLVFRVTRFEESAPNNFGEYKPTVWADVTVIDGDLKGTVYVNEDITHTQLVKALQEAVGGEPVLGRLVKGTQGGKPFLLNDPTDDDIAEAEAHFAGSGTDDDLPPF